MKKNVYNKTRKGGLKMEESQKISFPRGFFTQSRPQISTNESLKGVKAFCWSESVLKGKSKVILTTVKK